MSDNLGDPLQALLRTYHEPPEVPEDLLWVRIQAARQAERQRSRFGFGSLPRFRPGMAAAAAVVLLVGLSLGVQPVRAWVASPSIAFVQVWAETHLAPLVEQLRRELSRDAPIEAPAETLERQRFTAALPRDGILRVQVLNCQSEGVLSVEMARVPEVTLEALQPGNAQFRLDTNGLRIENRSESTSSYHLIVPAHARSVWMHLGEASPVRVPPEGPAGTTWMFHLRDLKTGYAAHCIE